MKYNVGDKIKLGAVSKCGNGIDEMLSGSVVTVTEQDWPGYRVTNDALQEHHPQLRAYVTEQEVVGEAEEEDAFGTIPRWLVTPGATIPASRIIVNHSNAHWMKRQRRPLTRPTRG